MRRLVPFFLLAPALLVGTASATAPDPLRSQQWDLDRIGAPAAWPVSTGAGVVVAVVDSGVDLHHEDLVGRLVPGHDFVDNDDTPQDAYGHGTHVAGIIAATNGNGLGISGVAPGARIMPVRVLGADGSGTVENVIAGIRWAVAHGAKVVNLSLGEDTQALLGPSFGDVLRETWAAGVIPVVAAGNQFLTSSGFSDEPAMVVAATDRNDAKPTYSSGVGAAKWGIAAPGGELPDLGTDGAILSTYWTGKAPNQYAYLAGTSQAAPHVSAALAILLSAGLTPAHAVQRLFDTARDIGAPGHDATFGAGLIDLAAATKGLGVHQAARPAAAARTTTTTVVRPRAASTPEVAAPPAVSVPPTTTTTTTLPATIVPRHPGAAVSVQVPGRDDGGDRTVPGLVAAALLAVVALQLRHRLLVAIRGAGGPEVL